LEAIQNLFTTEHTEDTKDETRNKLVPKLAWAKNCVPKQELGNENIKMLRPFKAQTSFLVLLVSWW
jgi:hypothetical protein